MDAANVDAADEDAKNELAELEMPGQDDDDAEESLKNPFGAEEE